jgi:hypothetical protein
MINLRTSIGMLRVLAVLATIGLVACSSPVGNSSAEEISSTTTNVSSTVSPSNRWLLKEPCAAPCWEGITPSVTTAEEAQKLLQQNPSFSDVEIRFMKDDPNSGWMTWIWRGTQIQSEAEFDGPSSEHIIYKVSIGLRDPIKLKDITSAYGYPTYVQAEAEGGDIPNQLAYGLHLYYISSGFYLVISNTNVMVKPIISSEALIGAVFFFSPSIQGLNKALGRINIQNQLIPWQGTFDFDVYCNLQYKSDAIWHCR